MFPIDAALLPSLATRKALLVVDAQNDFLAEDGALPVTMPIGLSQKISDLANDFRRNGGEIIWVQSQFEVSRPIEEAQIMTSNVPSSSAGAVPPRGRRSRTTPPVTEPALSPEAFLTPDARAGPTCVKAGAPGTEMHPVVKQAVGPRDLVLVKTFYSAFKLEELLRVLRVRFVTELFICGSLINVGVMATAIDAASYGYTITIVDDCCGAQSMSRHRAALGHIKNTTGCDTLSAAKILNLMKPKPTSPEQADNQQQQQQQQRRGTAGGKSPTVRLRRGKQDAIAPSASDIQPSFERLSLSGEPAAADEHEPTVIAPPQQRRQQQQSDSKSQSQSQLQSQSPSALQPVARPNHPQTKNQTDRDTVIATPNRRPSAANYHNHNHNSNAYVPAAAAVKTKNSDDGRYESARLDEDDEQEAMARTDPLTWGLASSLPSPTRISQHSQQSTPPISLSKLSPNSNSNDTNDAKNADLVVNEERNSSKGVESPSTTTNNASSSGPSREESESLETPPTPISRTLMANTTTSCDPLSPSNTRDSTKQNSIMTPQLPLPDAQSPPLCEGDAKVIYNILPEALSDDIFARIRSEVAWQRMSHQGGEVPRLVAVQGLVEADGSKPVYRHPADESPPLHPFTPAVDAVRAVVEKELGHPLNHVLIQLYRAGTDYISEHSDKTLDIVRDSFIANVSLGAERTMTLRTKRKPRESKPRSVEGEEDVCGEAESGHGGGDGDGLKRQVQRARLPHNSLFQMGLATNARWLHGIRQDKRAPRDRTSTELAYDGVRISLTFRRIGTFLTSDEARIWGQGATAKTRESARAVVNGMSDNAIAMLKAFGRENQDAEFDWEERYGPGFDVLHITAAKRLFFSGDAVANLRLRSLAAELGISYARGSLSGGDDRGAGRHAAVANTPGAGTGTGTRAIGSTEVPVKFVDNDEAKTVVLGQRNIMLYLEKTYGGEETSNEEHVVSERFERGMGFLDLWRSSLLPPPSPPSTEKETDAVEVTNLLSPWEEYAAGSAFIAGPEPSLADFAFWPVLHDIFSSPLASSVLGDNGDGKEKEKGGGKFHSRFPHLRAYHDRMQAREAIAQILSR